jgi:hypothetical protein
LSAEDFNSFMFFFSFQVVGSEHNTLVFDIKSPASRRMSGGLTHNTLFVCVAGVEEQRARLEFYVQETFR